MRPIKFRAFYREQMYEVKTLDWEGGEFKIQLVNSPMLKWADDCQLMQFTGLTDKNGKEIYEGDIIKSWRSGAGEYCHHSDSDVYFDDFHSAFVIRADEDEDPYQLNKYMAETEYEVIGNIYENPELLN